MSDIAINPVTRRVQFTGNTGTGPYAFNFNILQSSDIVVYKNNVLLAETADYTVSIATNGTGTITMSVALVTTDILTIIGGRELSRTTDFVTAGDLLASSLNEQLDSNVIMSQQLDERFDRTIKAQPGDEDATFDLPLVADRADKILSFDTEGNVATISNTTASIAASILGANYIKNTFTGDGATTAFTLSDDPVSKNNIQIYVNGIYQPKDSFSLSTTTLTFSEAPPSGIGVECIIGQPVTSYTIPNKFILGDGDEVTIASGVITASKSYHEVDTESDASTDDLDTINGGSKGMYLVLTAANSARTVVVKDGTGNIQCSGDFSLTHINDSIKLIYNGSSWLEISRSNNDT